MYVSVCLLVHLCVYVYQFCFSIQVLPFQCIVSKEYTFFAASSTGTTNFVHSYPNVCVSIALVVNKEVVVGVVFNPIMNELFAAAKVCGRRPL